MGSMMSRRRIPCIICGSRSPYMPSVNRVVSINNNHTTDFIRKVFFVVGTPGCGKETYCQKIIQLIPEGDYIVIDKLGLGVDPSTKTILKVLNSIMRNSSKRFFLM
jgi:ABC-type dipeptide/oligopeptide/nickel transport system ATPase component